LVLVFVVIGVVLVVGIWFGCVCGFIFWGLVLLFVILVGLVVGYVYGWFEDVVD